MYFDERDINGQERVTNGNAGMRKRTRVEHDEVDTVFCGFLHPVDQLMFGIALVAIQRMSKFFGQFNAVGLDVIELRGTVYLGLA